MLPSLPGMLLIGSEGRNSGKTELACSVLGRHAKERPVLGLKVTAIRSRNESCPRGGKGCGVCSSLKGDFDITQETDAGTGKDTSRLLAAGAERVFWLRCMHSALADGLQAWLDVVGPDPVCVCESNSLRRAVEPGLFLMVRNCESEKCKASARSVRSLADRTLTSNGTGFDIETDRIQFRRGRWILEEDAAAIVLAGGSSTRMGRDKSMLQIEGKSLIERICWQLRDHFARIMIVANDEAKYAFLGFPVLRDKVSGQGPLMGIATGLWESAHELNMVAACDIPEIDIRLAHRMVTEAAMCDIVVPRTGNGRLEPLFAVYHKRVAGIADELLTAGERKVRRLFDRCNTRFVDLSEAESPINLNTEEDLLAYDCRAYDALR